MFQTFVLKKNFDGMGSIAAVMVPFLLIDSSKDDIHDLYCNMVPF